MAERCGSRCVLEGAASDLAFRIGQALEQSLVTRAIELAAGDAGGAADVVVTADHVRRAVDGSLLAEACLQTGPVSYGTEKAARAKPTAG